MEEEHGIQILDAGTRQTGASNHLDTEATKPAREASFLSDGGLEQVDSSTPTTSTPAPAAAPRGDKDVHPDHDPDSTRGDSDDRQEELPVLPQAQDIQEVTIKDEPSSDGPAFVSERRLRKRKRDDAGWETPNPRPVKVKPRGDGSSPELSLHHCGFNPQESLDLGDVTRLTYTPRKRLEVETAHQSDKQPAVHDSDAITALVARHGQGQGNAPQDTTFSSVLTPVNVNRQLPSWTASTPADKPLRKGLSHGISVLAEDGATYKQIRNGTPGNSRGVSPAVKGRLDTLLNSPSPREDAVAIIHSAKRVRETPVTPREELPIPKPRELPFEKSARQSMRGSTAQTPQATPRTPLSDTTNTARKMRPPPQGKRIHGSFLRNKPLSELRLDDFKVNPRTNEGHDFAYSEVVRDKDERACLPGCVDMHCCGKVFRALALSQRPDPPLTAAQRQEEQKLLEDYLGDYAYRLAAMTGEERSELWVEAKMRELANKHGKHRHRFSRMRSPPGFWNADFPSTQELEADRAEAAKREKQAIQERHREAMRPGGRWIFRDE